MTRSLCIVGAGMAGAGAAYALREADVDVTILEKNRGVGGRAATRRKHGCTYDHGANYVKSPDERTADLVRELGEAGLVDVTEPVWTFDADGAVSAGEEDRGDDHKWTWEAGITQFAERLLDRTDAAVHTETRVEDLGRNDDGRWYATDATGERRGPFDATVLTPPAPQTASLLGGTKWDHDSLHAMREAAGAVPFRTQRTVVLNYGFAQDRPWYGLVNTDRDHDVAWVSREECKRGHVPEGESLLVVQMAPGWSAERDDDPLEAVAPEVGDLVADLVGDDRLREYAWADDQRWRYALPDDQIEHAVLERGQEDGLWFAGDWIAGEGRVHAALWNGYEVGEELLAMW